MPGSAGAVRAGRAYVELFADKSPLVRGLKSAESTLQGWGKTVSSIGLGAFAGGAAVGTGLATTVKLFADAGSELADMSARTGASVESLSKLGYAAGQTGTDMGAVEKGTKKLQDNLAGAVSGNQAAADSFARLGLNASQLVNMPVDQQFAVIAERLDSIENPALRTAAAIDLFGKSGTDMLPMLAGGAAGLNALTSRAEQLGLVMSTQDAQAADELGDRLDEVAAIGKRTTQVIGAALAPAAIDLANKVIDVGVAANQWIQENPQLVTTIAEVTAAVTAGGAALVGLGYSIQFAGTAVGGLAKLLPMVTNPIVATAGIATIGYLVATQTEIGQQALVAFADTFPGVAEFAGQSFAYIGDLAGQLATTVTTTWGGITDAIAAGDLALAGDIAMAGLNVVFQTGWREVSDLWTVTSTYMLDVWNSVSSGMASVGEHVTAFLTTLWIDASGAILDAWDAAKRGVIAAQEGMSTLILDIGYKLGIFSGSKEDAMSALRDQYDSQRNTINQDQQKRHAAAEADRQAARENLNAGLSGIDTAQQQRSDQLRQQQNESLLESQKKLEDSRGKLNELRDQAATEAADAATAPDAANGKKPGFTPGSQQKSPSGGGGHSEGTFSGLASSMNRGAALDPMDRLREAVEKNTDALKQQPGASIGHSEAAKYDANGMPLQSLEDRLATVRMPSIDDHLAPDFAMSLKPDDISNDTQNTLLSEIRDALNTLNGQVAETGTFTA